MHSKKEISELIVGLKEVALIAKAVMADGKISVADVAQLKVLMEKQVVLVAAFNGLQHINLKELSLSEIVGIVEELVEASKAVAKA